MILNSRIAKDVLGVAALLGAAALIGWHCYSRLISTDAPHDPAHTSGADFRDVMYYPTQAVLAGTNPYDSSDDTPNSYSNRFPVGNNFPLYSPLIFVPALPLAMLPLWMSVVIWWLVNVALTVVLAYAAWRWCGIVPSIAMTTALAAGILLSRPGYANLYFGQATLFFVLASLAALYWARSKPSLAGLALAVATIKPTFGGPLAILMFCRRDWKAASVGSIVGLAAAVIGLAIVFSRDTSGKSLMAVLRANQEVTDRDPAVDPVQSNSRIDAPLVVERLIGRTAMPLARLAPTVLLLSVTGFVLWRAASVQRSAVTNCHEKLAQLSTALILVTMAGCIYHNIYDGLLLVVPAALACTSVGRRGNTSSRWAGVAICALLIVPAISYFSSQQFGQLLARIFPAVITNTWSPGHTPVMIQLANGCAVIAAWLFLLATTWRAASLAPLGTLRLEQTRNSHAERNESLALATAEFPTTSHRDTSQYLISQLTAAPLPALTAEPKGVRP